MHRQLTCLCRCVRAEGVELELDNQMAKADQGKLQLRLVPTQIIRDIAEVREYGTEKYGSAWSWNGM